MTKSVQELNFDRMKQFTRSERGGFAKKNQDKEFSDSYFFSQSDKADIRDLIDSEATKEGKKLLFYKWAYIKSID